MFKTPVLYSCFLLYYIPKESNFLFVIMNTTHYAPYTTTTPSNTPDAALSASTGLAPARASTSKTGIKKPTQVFKKYDGKRIEFAVPQLLCSYHIEASLADEEHAIDYIERLREHLFKPEHGCLRYYCHYINWNKKKMSSVSAIVVYNGFDKTRVGRILEVMSGEFEDHTKPLYRFLKWNNKRPMEQDPNKPVKIQRTMEEECKNFYETRNHSVYARYCKICDWNPLAEDLEAMKEGKFK